MGYQYDSVGCCIRSFGWGSGLFCVEKQLPESGTHQANNFLKCHPEKLASCSKFIFAISIEESIHFSIPSRSPHMPYRRGATLDPELALNFYFISTSFSPDLPFPTNNQQKNSSRELTEAEPHPPAKKKILTLNPGTPRKLRTMP